MLWIAIGAKNCTLSVRPCETYSITRWKRRSARSSGDIREMSTARAGDSATVATGGAAPRRKFWPTMKASSESTAMPATAHGSIVASGAWRGDPSVGAPQR